MSRSPSRCQRRSRWTGTRWQRRSGRRHRAGQAAVTAETRPGLAGASRVLRRPLGRSGQKRQGSVHLHGSGRSCLCFLVFLWCFFLCFLPSWSGWSSTVGALQRPEGSEVTPTFPVQVFRGVFKGPVDSSLQSTPLLAVSVPFPRAVLPVTMPPTVAGAKWMPLRPLVRERLASTLYSPSPVAETAMPDSWTCSTLFLRTITFSGGTVPAPPAPVLVMSMPLPLADLILFFWTTMSLLRAPMKIADAGPGNCSSPTRAVIQLEVTRNRVLLKIDANDMSSTLLLFSISTSRWSLPLSAKKTAAPLWPSNRFDVIRTCWAPSSE